MIVMPANNTGITVGWLAGRFPKRLGHLYSPGAMRGPFAFMPYALDNGRFPMWQRKLKWDETEFLGLLERASLSGIPPRWLLVPDRVADRDGTLREWDRWATRLMHYGWPLAFAVQDGMTEDDVPKEASVVFVGGSTIWKWKHLHDWTDAFARVHVGRVNWEGRLWLCHTAGVESCDGTGWFRGDAFQLKGLIRYLERSSKGQGPPQQDLPLYAGQNHPGYRECVHCGETLSNSYHRCHACNKKTPLEALDG